MTLQLKGSILKNYFIETISELNHRGGPQKGEYQVLDRFIQKIKDSFTKGELSETDISQIASSLGEDVLTDTVHGMALLKPYGYAGDFEIIDKIYQYYISDKPVNACWDRFCQQHAAPKAVRNRKAYFKSVLKRAISGQSHLSLLNVASGPARDLKELYEEHDTQCDLSTTCVEMDPRAITYAKRLTANLNENICFVNANIFKFRTKEKFDLIWSAGLFDYFNDKAFKLALRRFKDWIKPGGEIAVGNFNDEHNPTRDYMELFSDWYLIHRTEDHLKQLARDVGFTNDQISVGREAENVNLFLHIKA